MIVIRDRYTNGVIVKRDTLKGADLRDADLSYADLYEANLEGADLGEANLYEARLRRANLTDANLTGADLSYANIISTRGIYTIQLDRDLIIAHASQVHIGCEKYSIDHWLEHYKEIGKKNGYTDKQIEIYGKVLEAIKLILTE